MRNDLPPTKKMSAKTSVPLTIAPASSSEGGSHTPASPHALFEQHQVRSRTRKGHTTTLRLASGAQLTMPPFAPVGEGDTVQVCRSTGSIGIVIDDGRTVVPLSPVWRREYALSLGGAEVPLTIKEVESEAELAGLNSLKHFHYRGEESAGRTVPLIAVANHPLMPAVVGFIEITSALLVNTARKPILDRPFTDPGSSVCWTRWDMATAKRHTRRLARISRCVVYPELRGLGVATILTEAAAAYARDRWQFGGAKPLFLEITADMLRYSPFVKGAGFSYVGETEGNEGRMLRDMSYLLRRTIASGVRDDFPRGGGGIMHLQRSYATTLLGVMSRRGLKLEQLLNLLRRSPEKLSDDEWIALHKVFRRPKPTYMFGLTEAATAHLHQYMARAKTDGSSSQQRIERSMPKSSKPVVTVAKLSLSTSATPSGSPRARKVAEAFGVVTKRLDAVLVKELSVEVREGEVALITGPSGTGKSLLLQAISQALGSGQLLPSGVAWTAEALSGTASVAWASVKRSEDAPVDFLAERSIEDALTVLSDAGLAEAPLFVRPISTLSDGQTYRLALAAAFAKEPRLLLVDAFCEPLDDLSAIAVCKRLRARTKRTGMAAVVATAAPSRLLAALKPDLVVQLLPGRKIVVNRHGHEVSRRGAHENKEGTDLIKAQGKRVPGSAKRRRT